MHKFPELKPDPILELIPKDEFTRIMSQEDCELEPDFMGFTYIYKALSEIIDKDKIVIDFGCYLAAQAYYFKDHFQYIGVDVEEMERFTPDNATHYVGSIQDYIKNEVPALFAEHDPKEFFAICSYVPDKGAQELVRKTFPCVFVYYPYLAPCRKQNEK